MPTQPHALHSDTRMITPTHVLAANLLTAQQTAHLWVVPGTCLDGVQRLQGRSRQELWKGQPALQQDTSHERAQGRTSSAKRAWWPCWTMRG